VAARLVTTFTIDSNILDRFRIGSKIIVYQKQGELNMAKTKVAPKAKPYDTVGNIMAFESGELNVWDTVELFVQLGNSGQVYHLQGSYGRMMNSLLKEMYIVRNANGKYENVYSEKE
jgi:hypothetical protein